MAFIDGDDLLALSTLVLVQPLPSPASCDLSSSWVVPAESPDLFQGTLEIVGRCVAHSGPWPSRSSRFWTQLEHSTFITIHSLSPVVELRQ